MKKITLRPIDEIARARAAECVARGEWIPSETWARFHRACKLAGLDVEATYLEAKRDAEEVAR
jgi:hypothetical protein